ncbi:MAG: T9SS type A sorting domain-containing protein [Candidatus Marinimicrobia bacterium]|nr:T9SS type A sorting domain-containing protein [Candidatus Neomarinimicrobiota bacterium]
MKPKGKKSASPLQFLYALRLLVFTVLPMASCLFGEIYPASAVWELTNPADGGTGLAPVLSGFLEAEDELLINTEINQYTGPESSQRVRIAGNAWPALQLEQIDSVYIQFSVTPAKDYQFHLDSISLKIAAASISTMHANIFYSKNEDFGDSVQIIFSPAALLTTELLNINHKAQLTLEAGERLYLRIFPWVHNDPNVRTGKYLCLKDVEITGEIEGEVVFDLPQLTTQYPTQISTQTAISDGTISSDGGAEVTERGVCWNTTGEPNISDCKSFDGTGSGSYTSQMTGLTNGTYYFVRAFATNTAGTGYGNEVNFTTLDSMDMPCVITYSVENIMVHTAECGGDVIKWGGSEITARGVCWATRENPTLADTYSEDGIGTGVFKSGIFNLQENTRYYVCAYATNNKGTGYGMTRSFTTQTPDPDVCKIVNQDGSGDYTTVQAAFDDVPDHYTGQWIIVVKPGVFYEKITLAREKINVQLKGEDPLTTILTYDDYAGKAGGTSKSQSVAIDADDFTAMNITFQNTVLNDGSFSDQQAVALRTNGDRQQYYNCHLKGYQDTFYTWGGRGTGRLYLKHCFIEGSVDFIFGRQIAVFDSCEIHINRNNGTLTAASTEADSKFGYVFRNCKITHDEIGFDGNTITRFYLGRPWQAAPRTVFMVCEEPAALDPAGWLSWNVKPGLYAEYQCFGNGSATQHRHADSRPLSDEEAIQYTLENIFSRNSSPDLAYDWMPFEVAVEIDESQGVPDSPSNFKLGQNYPNPFNLITTIEYTLPGPFGIKIQVFDLSGKKVATLMDSVQKPGNHKVHWNAEEFASGMYLYRMTAGNFIREKKMVLLK